MSVDFVKMIPELYKRRYLMQIQNIIGGKIPCCFFCGISVVSKVIATIEDLKNSGVNLTCVFVLDERHKEVIGDVGIPFVTPKDLPNAKIKLMLYLNSYFDSAFFDYFQRYGIDILPLIEINSREMMFNFYMEHVAELYNTHEMLADEESKKNFRAYIKGKLSRRVSDFKFAPEAQYFLEGFFPTEGNTVIDGGAYDGATARDFTMQGAKVYAFEMSDKNYPLCIERAEKYNFVIENLGLSSREGEERYIESGTGSRKGGGTAIAHFIDLDTYVVRKNIPRVDYIKLDIEGAELDMLHGAAKTIVRCKPKMAISAYHHPEDLWTLASYVKSLRSDYEFKFRHYKIDAKEYVLSDTERGILRDFGLDYFLLTQDEAVLYCR